MKLQTFIFNWNRVNDEVEKMYSQLQDAGIEATVINSTDNERDGWLNVGDDYWCYGQTWTAFNNFDYDNDYLNIIFGDVEYDDYAQLVNRTKEVLGSIDNIGVFAPDYSNKEKCWWTTEETTVDYYDDENGIEFDDDRIVASTICDFFCIAIHRDLVVQYKRFLDHFISIHEDFPLWKGNGWGTGTIVCILAHLSGMLVCRDKELVVGHTDVTGGDVALTGKYFNILMDEYKEYIGDLAPVFQSKREIIVDRCGKAGGGRVPTTLKRLWSVQ